MELCRRAHIAHETHARSVATLTPKSHESNDASSDAVSRRSFIRAAASSAVALPLAAHAASPPRAALRADPADVGAESLTVMLNINGQPRALRLDPRTTSSRRSCAIMPASPARKKAADHGQCGACTVHLDGTRMLVLPHLRPDGARAMKLLPSKGLGCSAGELHPMQQAFIDHDAFQCGYCTPGQIMSAVACVREGHADKRVLTFANT